MLLARPTARRLPALAALAATLTLGAAVPASADSLVFIKDHDVWLSQPDGSGQYRVTTDGTADNPYASPSQADDGTIVAMRAKPNGAPMVRMKQNGEVLNTIDPGALQAGPFAPHVSPDGRHVAFDIAMGRTINDYFETASDVRVVKADGSAPGQYELSGTRSMHASWVDSGRLLVGTGPVANIDAVGGPMTKWWSDYDHYSLFRGGEDLHDGEVAPGRAVFVRGYGDGKSMQLYKVDEVGRIPLPTCTVGDPTAGPNGRRFVDPTFSPDGTRLAYQMGDGIWAFDQPDPANCDVQPRLLIPGASEPDFGPADVNPGPRAQPAPPAGAPKPAPAPGAPGAPGAGPIAPPSGATVTARVVRPASLAAVGRAGLKVALTCPGACTVSGTATVDRATARRLRLRGGRLATATRRMAAAGSAELTLKPGRATARKLARLSRATVTVKVTARGADGAARTTTTTLRLTRR
jgi:hypothetical protein